MIFVLKQNNVYTYCQKNNPQSATNLTRTNLVNTQK